MHSYDSYIGIEGKERILVLAGLVDKIPAASHTVRTAELGKLCAQRHRGVKTCLQKHVRKHRAGRALSVGARHAYLVFITAHNIA